jgi:Mce-associated membrane protein
VTEEKPGTDDLQPDLTDDFETEIDADVEANEAEDTVAASVTGPSARTPRGPGDLQRIVAFGVLPAMTLGLAVGAGLLLWKYVAQDKLDTARAESVAAARDATVAILSYRADTVEADLTAARDLITGAFLDSYTDLVDRTVIPSARAKGISTEARVPAAASVSVEANRAVVLVFVDQTVSMEGSAPTSTASSLRVTLDKVGERWLVSGFDPV